MKPGEASRTAEYMALFRALETTRPAAERLLVDRLAPAFLSPRLRRLAVLSKVRLIGVLMRAYIDHRWPGARTSAVARTRYIDEATEAALEAGATQVVLLGAGFDVRAYRLGAMEQAAVFEVDHPSTSGAKRKVVESQLGSVPRHVRFVPVDFNTEPLYEALAAAGYDPRRRTLFIWEGVTNYLTEHAVDETLRWCSGAAPGSRLLFTYVHRAVIETPQAFWGTEKLFATLHAAGEHWTFGLDPTGVADFLAQRGLVLEEDLGAADYRALYYGRAAARMRGYEFYRLAAARVPAPAENARDPAPPLRASSSSGTTPA